MKLSIIIPIYNEENNLRALWRGLMKLEASQIIFVDGNSKDRSLPMLHTLYREECQNRSLHHEILILQSPKGGRAFQMNYGSEFANGDVLWFLHADSMIPETAVSDIVDLLKKKQAGCFRLRFAPSSFLMACCGRLSGLRVWSRKIIFGDQGLFLRKQLFEDLGKFAPMPIMEDYEFSLRMKKNDIRIGKTKSCLVTSSRRFTQNGVLKTMYQMQILQHRFRKGESLEKLYTVYQQMGKKEKS